MYENNLTVSVGNAAKISVKIGDNEFKVNMGKLFRNMDSCNGFSKKSPVHELMRQIGYSRKTDAQRFTKELGVTPSNLLKILRGTLHNEKIAPIQYWVEKLARGYNKGTYKWYIIDEIHRNIGTVRSLEKDNLHSLVPIAILSGCTSTQDMKQLFGKSLWKKLCNNSLTRNTLIFKCHFETPVKQGALVRVINNIPSSVLKYSPSVINKVATYQQLQHHYMNIIKSKRVSINTERFDLIRDIDCLRDTVRLYSRIHRVDPREAVETLSKRSTKNVLALHDALRQESMSRTAPSKDINWVSKYGNINTNVKDYTFTIYNTTGDIVKEGIDMRHCVGCYSNSVLVSKYLVISIRKDGKKVSTLGCRVVEDELKFDQHYKVMNTPVCKELGEVANTIIYRLNNHMRNGNEI